MANVLDCNALVIKEKWWNKEYNRELLNWKKISSESG